MKIILPFLLIAALASCSTGTTQVSSVELPPSDSLSVEAGNSEIATEEDPDALVEAIMLEIEKTWSGPDETKASEYTIHSTFTGYENTSKGKWVVDSLLNLRYCEVDWGMEGSSGSYSYVFEGDTILAGEEQNYYNDYEESVWIHSGFKPTYGFSKTEGTEDDSIPYFLQEADYISKNERANDDFSKLILRIRELQDSVSSIGSEITIVSEKIANHEEGFTETERYRLSRKLFDRLLND